MHLTPEEHALLSGGMGPAVQKAMRILETLGRIYGASQMLPVCSVQISGVSYDNLGEAGLEWLSEMAAGGGRAQVLTTLNPAGMDVENYATLGISEEFAVNQRRVLAAFESMGVITTCSCTPYLFGNLPRFGEHIPGLKAVLFVLQMLCWVPVQTVKGVLLPWQLPSPDEPPLMVIIWMKTEAPPCMSMLKMRSRTIQTLVPWAK